MVVYVLITNKKELEIVLEKIPRYMYSKKYLEQYETPSSIVAHILWSAYLRGDIENKVVADFGCGTGRFAVGSVLLGARKAICIDIDLDILKYCNKVVKNIYPEVSYRIIYVQCDINDIQLKNIDTVLMNPPFGVINRNRGIDMVFLRKAILFSRNIYTVHKYTTSIDSIIREIADSFNYRVTYSEVINFPIPMMYITHRRRIYRFKTIFYVLKGGLNE